MRAQPRTPAFHRPIPNRPEPLRDRGLNLAVAVNGIRRSPSDKNYYAKYGYYYLMPGAPSGNKADGNTKDTLQPRLTHG